MAPSTDERQQRIAALEERLRRRLPVGVRAEVALLVALSAAAALWTFQRRDLAYFFSPVEPISLGREGEYRFDLAASNRYAQIHGAPTTVGLYARKRGGLMVVVGLRDTPVMVRRGALAGEEWSDQPGAKPPQPDQRPFAVAGRLLAVDDAPEYAAQAAEILRKSDQLRGDGPLWILNANERPRHDFGPVLLSALLLGFIALNGYFAVQDLRRRWGRTAAPAGPGP